MTETSSAAKRVAEEVSAYVLAHEAILRHFRLHLLLVMKRGSILKRTRLLLPGWAVIARSVCTPRHHNAYAQHQLLYKFTEYATAILFSLTLFRYTFPFFFQLHWTFFYFCLGTHALPKANATTLLMTSRTLGLRQLSVNTPRGRHVGTNCFPSSLVSPLPPLLFPPTNLRSPVPPPV